MNIMNGENRYIYIKI